MNKRKKISLLSGILIASSLSQLATVSYANELQNEDAIIQKNEGSIIKEDSINNESEFNVDSTINQEDVYETYKVPTPRNIIEPNLTSYEQEDLKNLSEINYFKLKTDSKYEIALSHGNGTYTYLENASSLEEAMSIANQSKSLYKSDVIPVVINEHGLIVYATEGIAKIVKMKDGQPISQSSYIVELYEDSEGKTSHSYIVHSAIDDVPVIEANDKMVKIEVSGFNGWIPRSDEHGDNLIMVPVNDAVNLSHYEVNSNNQLVHSISTDVKTPGKSQAIAIGPAPSFMQPQKQYYSYDGMYFYDNINKLIGDLRAANHNNAVNVNNPYYNYYTSVPGRSETVYTAEELNKYIEDNAPAGSKLIGTGESFIKHQNKYGVNALMALSIAINESGFGNPNLDTVKKNNIFGLSAVDGNVPGALAFDSIDECIEYFMNQSISRFYYSVKWTKYNGSNLGNKQIGKNVAYASDPFWGEKAASHMYKIDLALSGGKLKEHNHEQIGVYTKPDELLSEDGQLIYKVLSKRDSSTAQVGDMVLIEGESNGKYITSPDRAKVLNPKIGTHNFNFKGYIDKNSVKLVNEVNDNQELKVTQLSGTDRYKTAIEVSKRGWKTTSDNVVLVNSGSVVDALSATPFAYSIDAPILLTQKDTLNVDTKKEIERLKAKNVYVIGGPSNVSENILSQLESMGAKVERISGTTRYETSLAVANKMENVSQIAVVNGVNGLPDAVSIAPVAAKQNMPIVLSSPSQGTATFDKYIENNDIQKSYVIGSTTSIPNSVANKLPNPDRIGGIDRNETNAKIVSKFYTNSNLNNILVAKDGMGDTGQLIDALAVGVLAAKEDSPLVIVGKSLNNAQKNVLSSKNPKEVTQIGQGIHENTFDQIANMYK